MIVGFMLQNFAFVSIKRMAKFNCKPINTPIVAVVVFLHLSCAFFCALKTSVF